MGAAPVIVRALEVPTEPGLAVEIDEVQLRKANP